MGSGLRNLGENMLADSNTPKNVHIFLSHYHWDHIVGFLTFKPLFDKTFTFNIFGANKNTKIEVVAKKLLDLSMWPVSIDMLKSKINFIELKDDFLNINDDVSVEYMNHPHPNGATSYKIIIGDFSILYTTDCEHQDNSLNQNVMNLARNVDVLIHDAHFDTEDLKQHRGWGHSSWENATNVAEKARVKQLVLFHFNPEYDDDTVLHIEEKAKRYFKNTVAAKQGLKITF